MGGEALFWIGIVVFAILMLAGFWWMDRPPKATRNTTRLGVPSAANDPRGRHDRAERVDPKDTTDRL